MEAYPALGGNGEVGGGAGGAEDDYNGTGAVLDENGGEALQPEYGEYDGK